MEDLFEVGLEQEVKAEELPNEDFYMTLSYKNRQEWDEYLWE